MKQKTIKWKRLDNVSKIFPATSNNKDTKVLRLACELNDDVEPTILQNALDMAMESFPLYRSVLRREIFYSEFFIIKSE